VTRTAGGRCSLVGVALFVVASAASALAPTALVLVLMRLVQGFAGGLISPQISGLIQSLFRGEERGKAFGLFGSTIAVSTAIGPLIGGALIALFGVHDGWRAVFFVNLPIGAAILLLARRYLPAPTATERRPQALDPLGVVLFGGPAAGSLAGLALAAARARRGSVVSDPVAGRIVRQRFLVHLAPVQHPPKILGDAGAREPGRVRELGFGDARSLTDERQNLLPVDVTLGRRARAAMRTRPPATAAPPLRPAALRLAGAFAARRRPVGECRFGLLEAFVFANQRAQLIQPCPQLRADGVK